MKKLFRNLLVSAVICSASISNHAAIAADTKATTLNDSSVIAEYDNVKVTVRNVMDQFRNLLDQQPNVKGKRFEELEKNMQENLARAYVNNKIITKDVLDSKIKSSTDFNKKIDEIKEQVAQQMFLEKMITQKVTPEDLKKEYEKLKSELTGKEEFKAAHILVKEESTAKTIKAKLAKGSKFEDLAKEYSIDEATKNNGGDVGYFAQGQFVPEFENKVLSMKKGEISEPLKTQFGWHIIKYEQSRPRAIPTYEEAKPQLQNKLAKDVIENYMKEININHKIKINL